MGRYLVTGASGFLGTHLVTLLAEQKHEIMTLGRTPPSLPRSKNGVLSSAPFTHLQLNLLHTEEIDKTLASCPPLDGIFHLAGKVSRCPDDAENMHLLHVEVTKALLDASRKKKVPRFIYLSSSGTRAVSPSPSDIANEKSEVPFSIIQKWPYYRSKYFGEKLALSYASSDFQVVSVNPSLLLGPGDIRSSSTLDVKLFLEGKIPIAPRGGLAFVDVRDAAAGILLAMNKGKNGEIYLLNACNLTIYDFFSRLARLRELKPPLTFVSPIDFLPPGVKTLFPSLKKLDTARILFAEYTSAALKNAKQTWDINFSIDPVSFEMGHYYWYVDGQKAETELGFVCREPSVTLLDTLRDLELRGVLWPSSGKKAPR